MTHESGVRSGKWTADVRDGSRLGSRVTQSRLPLFSQQQTFLTPAVTSEKCQ